MAVAGSRPRRARKSSSILYPVQYFVWDRARPEGVRTDTADLDAANGKQTAILSLDTPGFLCELHGGASKPFDNDGEFQFII